MTIPPSVDTILQRLGPLPFPHGLIVTEIRQVLDLVRRDQLPVADIEARVRAALERWQQPSLKRVINATGVVLHTNLGRAPLAPLAPVDGYSNLEYDLATGKRGKRDAHTAPLLERLLGVPAIAVNNNAAAVYLALHELAAGQEVIVSRGELIEIGDGFRIPDIMQRSGAILREVGATNKTSIDDYAQAINERTRLIMRVHPSNFKVTGFTAKPSLAELAQLGRARGVPVYEDLGSGCLVDLKPFGIDEPLVRDSLEAGVDLVSFSCDKLLGGPQTGLIAGAAELVQRIRRNPMYRAFRCDKLIVTSLEATLRKLLLEQYDQLPALWMIRRDAAEIQARAEDMAVGLDAEVIAGESVIGGGATPEQRIPTWLIALNGDAVKWERRLRAHQPPIIARIEKDRLLIDLRTVFPDEEQTLRQALLHED
ncbi:MAG: L-seryl-tRNA(Sec) selenium transferase [Acidobacteria bacterium]|nr:L-seryl-tRNA(Sec) selenium transferase [Acidobacteriota bacterium]